MRKHKGLLRISVLISVVLVIALMACAKPAPAPSPAKPIELKMAGFLPVPHFSSKLKEELVKDLETATQGRLKITWYGGGGLLGATQMYDGVIKGVADIGTSHMSYTRGRFPIFEVFTRPLGFPSPWVAGQVTNDFFKAGKGRDELKDVHVLYLWSTGSSGWFTKNKPVYKMEDLRGVTLRAVGTVADTIAALGGTGRDIPASEMFDALSKGVIDGAQFSLEGAKGFKLSEVCRYLTYAWQVSTVSIFYLVMNKDVWNSLPTDIQKAISDVAEKHRQRELVLWNQSETEGRDYHLSIKGNEFFVLPPEEAQRWVQTVQPVIDAYVKEMAAAKYSDKEMKDNIAYIKDQMKYWSQKEKELGIPTIGIK